MHEDRYGLPLATASAAAARAYDEGLLALLTHYPGALAAFTRALDDDPDFAEARIAKLRAQHLGGDLPGARATLEELDAAPLPERDASRLEIFRRLLAAEPAAALDQVNAHVANWPRDALVLATAASQTGLIALSGRPGREQALLDFLAPLAPAYAGDWWFAAHHGMALSELGHHARARPMIERSLEQQPHNASAAHAMGHVCYETGAHDEAHAFLTAWLAAYPRRGPLRGHLSWHLALAELERGNPDAGFRLFHDAFAAEDYAGPAFIKITDGASFLWRAELAGIPRDPARWQALHDFAERLFPHPGIAMADWNIALAAAAHGDAAALQRRIAEMEAMIEAGRFPWGPALPTFLRGLAAFAARDWPAAIAALERVLPERERLCGSRAQLDLIEATLLRAYLLAGREPAARALLDARRPGPPPPPVAGLATRH